MIEDFKCENLLLGKKNLLQIIQRYLSEILKCFGGNLVGIVFNTGKCITVVKRQRRPFLKIYEKRMVHNKNILTVVYQFIHLNFRNTRIRILISFQ